MTREELVRGAKTNDTGEAAIVAVYKQAQSDLYTEKVNLQVLISGKISIPEHSEFVDQVKAHLSRIDKFSSMIQTIESLFPPAEQPIEAPVNEGNTDVNN